MMPRITRPNNNRLRLFVLLFPPRGLAHPPDSSVIDTSPNIAPILVK
jgi:hypothetical protein